MSPLRSIRVFPRFLCYLLWEFRWPITVFWSLVFGGGFVLQQLYSNRPLSYAEACYSVFLLIFLESADVAFPDEWYLQVLFFLLPIIGLGAVVDSMVRLGYLVFASKQKLPEWQRMVASLYRNHIIVVGVGKVGFRIIQGLTALRESVVAIDRRPDAEFTEEVRTLGVPIIPGNGRHAKVLEEAGVKQARAVILATDDDLGNLDAALTAQDLNPKIRVVLRLFDESLACKFTTHFAMPAIVTSQVSAQAFVAAATNRKVYHDFQLDGSQLHLTDVTVASEGALAGQTVGKVQAGFNVNVVMHRGTGGVLINPGHDIVLHAGDTLLVIALMQCLNALEAANHPDEAAKT
jgi:Trk K+ transport system NAD-binding subunit